MDVREVWKPKRMTASGMLVEKGRSISGFLCTTGGTLQITDGEVSGGSDVIASITVVAATYYPMPFYFQNGAYAVLGGGAAGTFGV